MSDTLVICPKCGNDHMPGGRCRECDIEDYMHRASCRECETFLIRADLAGPLRDQHAPGCSLKDSPNPYPVDG